MGIDLNWVIEQSDHGQYYLKFVFHGTSHNSDGIGDGIVSLFSIVDSLFNSKSGAMVVIDEPELSLHPMYQKRLMNVILDYSKTRQIVVFTHSPYFISFEAIANGGKIARTVKETNGINIYELSDTHKQKLENISNDRNNPHTLGLEAKEAFFLEDNIVLVEGQEDVWYFNHIDELKGINGAFFGWGAGGAEKMEYILHLLQELGFKKVAVILDKDKTVASKEGERSTCEKLKVEFSNYCITHIPADDIRDKEAVSCKPAKQGLIAAKSKKIKAEHKDAITNLISSINSYFSPQTTQDGEVI